jgi:1-acyl-sn-glycerol-3-phosphate acyltransferase
MSDNVYNAVRLLGSPFSYRCVGLEHVQGKGPAIYVANHLGATGPIQAILSLPVRLYPWIIAEMADFGRAPRYLYDDFVHPTWRLRGWHGRVVAALVSRIAVWLIRGVGCIAVDRNRGRFMDPFRRSLALLSEGRNLFVLPEDSKAPPDPETGICPFLRGFILLCPLYEALNGDRLPVYPVAVSSRCRVVSVGAPLYYEARGRRRDDILRLGGRLEQTVREMYRDLEAAG